MARYLYAVTRAIEARRLEGQTGIDGRPLAVISQSGLGAVVSDVDLASFGEEGLRRNLESMEWLERVARKHDAVVHAVARTGPTAPFRLATICLDDDGVRADWTSGDDEMPRALDRVEGRREWSVKVVVPPPPAGTESRPATPQSRREAPGRPTCSASARRASTAGPTERDAATRRTRSTTGSLDRRRRADAWRPRTRGCRDTRHHDAERSLPRRGRRRAMPSRRQRPRSRRSRRWSAACGGAMAAVLVRHPGAIVSAIAAPSRRRAARPRSPWSTSSTACSAPGSSSRATSPSPCPGSTLSKCSCTP